MSEHVANEDYEIPSDLDFSQATASPYAELARRKGHRVLDEDVRDAFPDSDAVNKALRGLIEVARSAQRSKAA